MAFNWPVVDLVREREEKNYDEVGQPTFVSVLGRGKVGGWGKCRVVAVVGGGGWAKGYFSFKTENFWVWPVLSVVTCCGRLWPRRVEVEKCGLPWGIDRVGNGSVSLK